MVGIGCRFPGGVTGPGSFWESLLGGVDAITDVPPERWDHALFHHPTPVTPGRTPARQAGFLPGIDLFDASFFGISPREAAQMDPQHRLLLEVAWEALEDAGLPLARVAGPGAGVFVGISTREYALLQTRDTLGTHSSTGQATCMAANRLSYAFDLRGPSLAVDTACSSALVAVHLACQSLWAGESSLALAGGVNLMVDPTTFVGFSQLSMLSPDSRCFAFDARANGFVRGEGAGVVVLEPLARALAAGDRVYAVILGTGSNQDGHSQGLTFPSQASQEALLREVGGAAGVGAADFRFVEAHGTGTAAGDPVEAAAIGEVLGRGRKPGRELWLASVKTNVGHLEAAAGIAGLVKAVLAVHHRRLPPNLHFREPSPRIAFAGLGLRVPVEAQPLEAPVVAAVNSFGFGGTNACVVLAEAPPQPPTPCPARSHHLLVLSARGAAALREVARQHQRLLGQIPEDALGDVLHAAAVRRTHHPHRLAVVGASAAQIAERLAAWAEGRDPPGAVSGRVAPDASPRVAFVYSGQGSQWWAMGRELLATEPVFRAEVERCERVVRDLGGWSLLEALSADEAGSRIGETAVAQPALFAVQAGLTALWRACGVEPEVVVGHSVGEIAAAHAAGVVDLEEGARIAFHRGRTMDRASSRGRMLSVGLPVGEVARYLEGHGRTVGVAAVNSPVSVALSGDPEGLEAVARALTRDGVAHRAVRVGYAFHSPQMDAVEPDLRRALRDLAPRPASRRLVSTVTGRLSPGAEWDASYWWHNLRDTVRFAEAIGLVLDQGCDTFVEVGPHPVLAVSVQECARARALPADVVPSLRRGSGDQEAFLGALAELHVRGHALRLSTLYPRGRVASLPSYPWQRERHWSEAEERRRERFVGPVHPLLGRPRATATPSWEGRVRAGEPPWVAEHRFQGHALVPAAAWLDAALAAGAAAGDLALRWVEDVTFDSAAFVPEDDALLLESRLEDDGRFEIAGRQPGEERWSRHVAGRLTPAAPPVQGGEDPAAIAARLPEEIPPAEIYAAFREVGLDYGPAFRGIARAQRREGGALGEVRLPEALEVEASGHVVHPALLDACLQVVLAALPAATRSAGRAFLPVGLRRLRLHRPPGCRVWSHVRLTTLGDGALVADVRVLDEGGEPLLSLEGFRCRAVEATGAGDVLDPLLYRFAWRPQALPAAAEGRQRGTWLVFADAGGLGEQVRSRLLARGDGVASLRPGPAFADLGDSRFALDPARPGGLRTVLDRLGDAPPLAGVVHLWALDTPEPGRLDPEALDAAEVAGALTLVHLVQALEARAEGLHPRMVIVTSRAQAVGEGERARVSPAQAALWGFRRVLAREHPSLPSLAVDVGDPLSDAGALLAEIVAAGGEDEVALRGAERFVHRYERASLARCAAERAVRGAPGDLPFRAESRGPGVLDNLRLVACPDPEPGPGEVVVEVRAAGLNFADVLKALALYPGEGPFPLGAELAGVVRALGPPGPASPPGADAGALRVGDRVLGIGSSAFASRVRTPAAYVVPVPAGLGFEQAAAVPVVFLTAHYALAHVARLRPGERVLVHSASGGVGLAALQVARHLGAEVLATAGTEDKREFLRDSGLRHVFDSRSLAFADQVRAATGGEGVDVVLNSLVGEALVRGIGTLRPFGRFVEIGKRDIYAGARLGLGPFRDNLSFAAVDLDQAIRQRPDLVAGLLREVHRGFVEGWLSPLPVRVFPMTEVVEAFRFLQKAQHVGKVVLSNDVPEVEVLAPPVRPPIRPDATYLVSGGLGGLGGALAEWLAGAGARHVLLLGRRGPDSPEAERVVSALARRGCAAHVRAVDVADEGRLRAVLEEAALSLPPLRGVVHAAVVFDDGVVARLDRARLAAVTRPKALGAWNLHRLTRGAPLDFFLMASSIAGVYGSPGQASYAAANAFLDALAEHRRGRGLPALALDLGPVGDVGHVTRHPALAARFAGLGLPLLGAAEVARAFETLLASDEPQLGVAKVDWGLAAGASGAPAPRFAELARSSGSPAAGTGPAHALAAALEAAAPEQREPLLISALGRQLARILGTTPDRVEAARPLSELGLDSLMGVELGNWVEEALGFRLPAAELMRDPSVSGLAGVLLTRWGASRAGTGAPTAVPAPPAATADLRAEAVLDPAVAPGSGASFGPLRNVLLTGATGFLGSFLLRELLRVAVGPVRCLVRAGSVEEGRRRIRSALEERGLWEPAHAERIVPVPGDLGRPLLGLPAEAFEGLAGEVEGVVHAGAAVDFLRTYEAMRAANVLGTHEALRLACHGRPRAFHHVSTIAVFGPERYAGQVAEDEVPDDVSDLPDGYSRSKWVAERLVLEAARRGLPVRVYRPGILTGDRGTGESNRNDALLQLFRASCLIGLAPDLPARADLTPVDVAAQALVWIASRPELPGNVFHLCSEDPLALGVGVGWVQALGIPLRVVPYEAWRAEMAVRAEPLGFQPLLALLPETEDAARSRMGAEGRRFATDRTRAALEGGPVALRPVDAEQVAVYVRWMERSGLLEGPAASTPSGGVRAGRRARPAARPRGRRTGR